MGRWYYHRSYPSLISDQGTNLFQFQGVRPYCAGLPGTYTTELAILLLLLLLLLLLQIKKKQNQFLLSR